MSRCDDADCEVCKLREILTELEIRAEFPTAAKPSQGLFTHGLVVWDGGSAKVENEFEPVRPPAWRITPAGRVALEAWKLAPP